MGLLNCALEFDPKPTRIFIGVSGGLDSIVLLDLLAVAVKQGVYDADQCVVLHVNHHLQAQSNQWAEFVQSLAEKYSFAFECCHLEPADFEGENVEAKARDGRYAFFKTHLTQPDDFLLLAHHQQDQVETFFLNLQRGSGLAGLAAMPKMRRLGQGKVVRPLLDYSREVLQTYVETHQLKWLEDPSNKNLNLNRNFLRHEILPHLKKRWPHFEKNTGAAILRLQEARNILDDYLSADLLKLGNPVDLKVLKTLPASRYPLLLQQWIKQQSGKVLSEVQLMVIVNEVIAARADAHPVFEIPGLKIYRKKQQLILE